MQPVSSSLLNTYNFESSGFAAYIVFPSAEAISRGTDGVKVFRDDTYSTKTPW
ncbi:MAG: hypothetical protein GX876_10720 [Bacteroidales bacterium]|nr:hypothetical protein [Bacteroidales bacterium]